MSEIEQKLNKIKVRKPTESEKNSIWLGVVTKRESYKESFSLLQIFNFKKHMIGALIALMVILGGGGAVAASNSAVPGDSLYGLDLAVEKAKLNFVTSAEKKDELRVKFADERVSEARMKSDTKASANTDDIDLSMANITEIEVDIFTNETTVKIEANDRHYGFITAKKVRAEVVSEIATKYNIDDSKVDAMIDFETEDRASRAEDKEFLNSSNSVGLRIESEKEKRDFEMSLKSLSDMDGLSTESQVRLNAAINEIRLILEANPDSKIKIENGDFKIEVKENGMIKFDSRDDDRGRDDDRDDEDKDDNDNEDDNRGHGNDDDGEDDDNPGQSGGVNVNVGAGVNLGGDTQEDDNEVFCRGEWRDPEDCDNGNSDEDDSEDDNGGNDDSEDDDGDNSGSGNDNDDDDDNDDDNSGRDN